MIKAISIKNFYTNLKNNSSMAYRKVLKNMLLYILYCLI